MSLQVTIGTAPCSWGVWWPDGTPSGTPYNVFLDQAAEAGYKALELGPVGYLPTDIGQLRDELASRGLSICGGTACYDFLKAASFADVRADVDELCKRLLAFDVHYLMTMDGTAMSRETKAGLKEQQERTYRIFGEMGRYCRDTYGIEILMHPERCSLIETREELERLIDLDLCICRQRPLRRRQRRLAEGRPQRPGLPGGPHRPHPLPALQERLRRGPQAGAGRRPGLGRSQDGRHHVRPGGRHHRL